MTWPFLKKANPLLKMINPLFKKILVIYLAIILCVPVVNFLISKSISKDKKNYLKHVRLIQKEAAQEPPSGKKRKHKLVPADPRKYGMTVISSVNLPKNQEHADVFMKKVIKESGVFEQKEVVARMKEQNISPAEFEERSKILDDKIASYEEKKAQAPLDEDAQERLQQLYLLKSFQNALKDTVVIPAPKVQGTADSSSQDGGVLETTPTPPQPDEIPQPQAP